MWFLNVVFVVKAKNKVGNFIFTNLATKRFLHCSDNTQRYDIGNIGSKNTDTDIDILGLIFRYPIGRYEYRCTTR